MKLAKLLMLLLVLLSFGGDRRESQPTPDGLAKLSSEVRLRKLHLVRPDLIGYPIVFEVYC
jgi:hypothetical protein